ncbi:hypothetical protein WMY93_027720 [Mugilogobius chulae]|uniref:Pre-rRNA-processing protein TSR2 homolog n=1 Tax=Mugilogobius chulae TaxID=88201 RepID=A0AAW0MZL4_9GOBI
MAASSASRELFTAGVRAVLHDWPVLQIAVDNGFGGVYGQQKADWMVDVVQQYFHDNADLQQFEVEDYISTLMDQEFDTVVDDGSLPQLSKDLLQMFSQWKQGALQQLQASIDKQTPAKRAMRMMRLWSVMLQLQLLMGLILQKPCVFIFFSNERGGR